LQRCGLTVRACALLLALGAAGLTASVAFAQETPTAPTAETAPASPDAAAPSESASDPAQPADPAGDLPIDPETGLPIGPATSVAIDPLTGLPIDPEGEALLPRDLSPWAMFMQADWVVKAVMIGLAFASVVTWTVWLAKTLELASARRRTRRTLQALQSAASLGEAVAAVSIRDGAAAAIVQAAAHEMRLSSGLDAAGIKERLGLVTDRIVHAAGRQAGKATGLLATIGATAPFVGLFGTVWGIMNSFIGISEAQTTNLAVVAPGIAEALLATAIGLAAAIPAVVIYNHFTRLIAAYRALLSDAAAGVLQLVSRDLDRDPLRRSDLRRDAAE
ncbi:MAG TPA: tonB-system energizer ExbB, partial [Dongiaceae bacterium]|nr:tonB-system energizer ExbB [Dongiaceae bacterium]